MKIFFWLHWVFFAACGLFVVAHRLLRLWHSGSRVRGLSS